MSCGLCQIHKNRPPICSQFPTTAFEIKDFDECTYYFKDGKRFGFCCKCGQCCKNMPWAEGSNVSLNKIDYSRETDETCRFLT